MGSELITQLGVPVIAVLLILDKVIALTKKPKTCAEHCITGNKLRQQVEEVHRVLMVDDVDGVKRIYTPRSLETALMRLADVLEKQTEMLQTLGMQQKDMLRELGDGNDRRSSR